MKYIRFLCILLIAFSSSIWAQDSGEWDWRIAPYLWTVNISGDLAAGGVSQDLDVSFSDILDDFDVGGSLFLELGKDKHAVHVDYTYMRLKPDPTVMPSPPFPPDSQISSKTTINIFESAYNYRYDGAGGAGAIVLGVRYMDVEMKLTPTRLPQKVAGPNWWDAFIGVKTHNAISTNWDFDFYATLGHGGSELPWTIQGVFARRFSNDNRLALGIRVWGIDYRKDEGLRGQRTVLDATFAGFLIGYEFN
jgi:hypothetical protein